MPISVTDPISQAYERTVLMLFRPFSIGKWLTLGFCAWLSVLGEGGSANFNFPGGGGGGGGGGRGGPGTRRPANTFPDVMEELKQLFLQHAYWIVPVAIAALALLVVVMWVRARGKFMFLEGVAYDRAAVVEPWKRLRPLANSFFRFELALSVVALLTFALVALVVFLLALPDIRVQQISGPTIAALVIGGLVVLGGAIVFGVVSAMTEDFVIPLMYLRGHLVGPAWREFSRAILRGNVGSIVLFYLMRIVVGMAAGMIVLIGTCVTCCLAALPYVYAVVFLPVFVFTRAYSLYFLRQFGPQYNLLADIIPPLPSAFPVLMPAASPDLPPPPPPGDGRE